MKFYDYSQEWTSLPTLCPFKSLLVSPTSEWIPGEIYTPFLLQTSCNLQTADHIGSLFRLWAPIAAIKYLVPPLIQTLLQKAALIRSFHSNTLFEELISALFLFPFAPIIWSLNNAFVSNQVQFWGTGTKLGCFLPFVGSHQRPADLYAKTFVCFY